MSIQRFLIQVLAPLTLAAGQARAGVITVGPTGQNFTTIQAGVDAAVDGDVLLVKPGSYASFQITSKALAVVADGAGVNVNSPVTVASTSAGQIVHLSGLTVSAFPSGPPYTALTISNCSGIVRLQDLTLTGVGVGSASLLQNSPSVSFARCTLRGATGFYVGQVPAGPGGGLSAQNSGGALYDCQVLGGNGQQGGYFGMSTQLAAHAGAPGCALGSSSTLFCSGGNLRGGNGGSGASGSCFPTPLNGAPGADGASALQIDATSHADLLDCSLVAGSAGQGGAPGSGGCTPGGTRGQPASTIGGSPANANSLAGTHRLLSSSSPARELTNVVLSLSGQPGDRVLLIFAAMPRHELYLAFNGVLLYGEGARRALIGTLPGSGTMSFTLPIADLGPGVQTATRYLQCAFIDTASQVTLSDPLTLVLLDQAY